MGQTTRKQIGHYRNIVEIKNVAGPWGTILRHTTDLKLKVTSPAYVQRTIYVV